MRGPASPPGPPGRRRSPASRERAPEGEDNGGRPSEAAAASAPRVPTSRIVRKPAGPFDGRSTALPGPAGAAPSPAAVEGAGRLTPGEANCGAHSICARRHLPPPRAPSHRWGNPAGHWPAPLAGARVPSGGPGDVGPASEVTSVSLPCGEGQSWQRDPEGGRGVASSSDDEASFSLWNELEQRHSRSVTARGASAGV